MLMAKYCLIAILSIGLSTAQPLHRIHSFPFSLGAVNL